MQRDPEPQLEPRPRPRRAWGPGLLGLLGLILIFPFGASLLLAEAASDPSSLEALEQELRLAVPWGGAPAPEGCRVALEGLLQPGPERALLSEPQLGGELLLLEEQRLKKNSRGPLTSWRRWRREAVTCVLSLTDGGALALDLNHVASPLGLPLLLEQGSQRLYGLRVGQPVTVLARSASPGRPLQLDGALLFASPSRAEALETAVRWRERTAALQALSGSRGRLLIGLGVGLILARVGLGLTGRLRQLQHEQA